MEDFISILTNPGFYSSALRMATPILLAAMGGLIAERSGVLTFCAEGFMLFGAFFGFLGSDLSGSVWVGFLTAALSSLLFALLYALLVVTIGVNQVVSAVALNIFAFGLTSFLFSTIWGVVQVPLQAPKLAPWIIPGLSKIPFIGSILFEQNPLVLISLFTLPVVYFVLFKTEWGLNVRAVGEHPLAADTLGIKVRRTRYQTILIAGILAGIAGAYLSIGELGSFVDNMAAGRGYIAYTAIVFGKWMPLGTYLGVLLFGVADALQMRIQGLGLGIPNQIFIAAPYILTIIVLTFFVGKAQMPAASGKPYQPEANT